MGCWGWVRVSFSTFCPIEIVTFSNYCCDFNFAYLTESVLITIRVDDGEDVPGVAFGQSANIPVATSEDCVQDEGNGCWRYPEILQSLIGTLLNANVPTIHVHGSHHQ